MNFIVHPFRKSWWFWLAFGYASEGCGLVYHAMHGIVGSWGKKKGKTISTRWCMHFSAFLEGYFFEMKKAWWWGKKKKNRVLPHHNIMVAEDWLIDWRVGLQTPQHPRSRLKTMVVWQAGSTSLPKCGRTYSHGTCMGGRGIKHWKMLEEGFVAIG